MTLDELVAAELGRRLPVPVRQFATALAGDHAGAVAVLFYGSCLRDGIEGGMPDFYLLTERPRLLDRVLPPTVRFIRHQGLYAKVAVMAVADFRRAMRAQAPSPHLWARFCQPVALAWSRDAQAVAATCAAVTDAIRAAGWWAERLGGWSELFRHTYAAELRVERGDRPALLAAGERWERVSALVFTGVSDADRAAARRSWTWRRRLGRLLAAARLVKAAFTVVDGTDYVAWKIERHTGRPLALTDWQRRHPLLAALPLLARLKRQGLIR